MGALLCPQNPPLFGLDRGDMMGIWLAVDHCAVGMNIPRVDWLDSPEGSKICEC